MSTTIAPGHSPILSWRDFPIETKAYVMVATGTVRARQTPHGARLIVECHHDGNVAVTRAFFVSLKSRSYVRLCDEFGDNLAKWRGQFPVRVVRDARDGRRRVEVV